MQFICREKFFDIRYIGNSTPHTPLLLDRKLEVKLHRFLDPNSP